MKRRAADFDADGVEPGAIYKYKQKNEYINKYMKVLRTSSA